jgi:C-terminal processing protease CtpA/Prc
MLRVFTSTVLCIAIAAGCCFAGETEREETTISPEEVERFRAFAKLYGYVRFFHPSDEAADIDWDRFAVMGVIRIREAGPSGDLLETLNHLFMPIAPTVRIYPTGSGPEPVVPPEDTASLKPVAWQHLGVRLPGKPSIYKSKRTNREARFSAGGVFGTVIQSVDATPYRGRKVRLTASIRTEVEGEGNQGQMWLRVDRESGGRGFFNNMGDRPVTSNEWGDYEIVGEVADDAEWIVFGCFLLGVGQAWVDDFRLDIGDGEGGWNSVELENPGFEDGEVGAKPVGWSARTPGYLFEVRDEEPHRGERSVMITHQPDEVVTEDLFEARPAAGEVIDAELGAGLSARIPMVVWSNETSTIPAGGDKALKWMRIELDSVNMMAVSEYSECTRLAGVVIAWNVLQHFYPYFDVVDVDWDAVLTRALDRALADESGEDYFANLRDMAVALQDGHAQVIHYRYRDTGYLPLALEWIEDQVVVTASTRPEVEPGDIITGIDGTDSLVAIRVLEDQASGSPQWKRNKALTMLGAGEVGDAVSLTVRRGEEQLEVEIELEDPSARPSDSRPETIEEIDDGVFYVDLTRASMPEITNRIIEISAARGVIFDLRGYPNGNHQVISHLLTEPDTSDAWMRIPEIIYPDHVEPAGWQSQGWEMQPMEPHIGGEVVFITDGSAISYAESFMGLIDGYDLAEIVGQPTAGTNGNVNPMELPGRFTFYWTGMKVVTHDGKQHHLTGVQPTIPAQRTVRGVREGRDELLEKAIEMIDRAGAAEPLDPVDEGGA